jgi:hypothetical protein
MFCTSCGKQVPGDSKFCEHCGASITNSGEHSATKDEIILQNGQPQNVQTPPAKEKELQAALLLTEAKKAANRMILGGIGWIVAGLVVTGVTYSIAEPGGTYFVFWGLSVYGLYRLVKGIYYRVAPQKLIAEALSNIAKVENETKNEK